MDNSRRPRRQQPLTDSGDGRVGYRNSTSTTSPHTLSLARNLIDQLPDHSLRDVLRSVAHLTLVQDALITSTISPTSTESFRSKRPKRSPPTPSGSRHGSLSPYLDSRPTRHDLSATTQPIALSEPLTPQMQQTRRQLLILIHRVNVYYSNTFNTADAVTCLLNIAHRALDQQSVPIRSPIPTIPEPTADSAASSKSSLPTPPRTTEVETAAPSSQPSVIIPIADDILSSLVMILIQYPRSKHIASMTTTSHEEPSASTDNEMTGDECDLTDALLEMVYALLDHEQYSQRPLAIRLSEFLVEVALRRERKFRDQERQKRKSLFSTQSNSFSYGRSINHWQYGLGQLSKTSGSGVAGLDRDSGIGMDGDLIGGGADSEDDIRGETKKRLRERQLQKCQQRVQDEKSLQQQDDQWGSFTMSQSNMDSPFIV
ncbi:hypothetical protein BG015_005780 [Linnemannia schmuckeri]|uniref:Uncharacterized protein n=1 Tax=Linnemannia schmuckeri TaxID=64567 RepID=A0A9P5VCE0_9FUNG|nr:hypothetical protein BG015_005780 [Linnemannia schmuckeri]